MLLNPASQIAPADQTSLVIVGSVIGSTRVGNIDCDHRDVGFPILRRYDGSNLFVSLELDGEIHFFTYQQTGIALCNLGAIAIIDADQFDTFGSSGPL